MIRGVGRKISSLSRIFSTKVGYSFPVDNGMYLRGIEFGKINAPAGLATWRYPVNRGYFWSSSSRNNIFAVLVSLYIYIVCVYVYI